MAPPHNRRLKKIQFALNALNFECQLSSWSLDPGIEDGDRHYTFCSNEADNSFIEETDQEATLELTFFSDWRSNGISDFLWANSGQEATFTINHHPGVAGEHVQWTGRVMLKAPAVGGEARAIEVTEITLAVIGKPTYTRIG